MLRILTAGWLGLVAALVACAGPTVLPLAQPASGAPPLPEKPEAGWPQLLRDAGHSGQATGIGPQTGHLRWQRDLGGRVTSGPVIGTDGTIYVPSNSGVLHALDPLTGMDRWVFDAQAGYGSDLTTSPALLADGTVLWPGPRNTLYAVNSQGQLLSKIERASTVLSPVVVDAHHFYLTEMGGTLGAYNWDGTSAKLRWELGLGESTYGGPVVARDGTLRLTAGNSAIAVQDLGDRGSELWRFTAGDLSEVTAGVAADGTTVFGTNDGHEYGLNGSGKQVWAYQLSNLTYSSPGVGPDGVAVFGDSNGVVAFVRTSDGTEIRRVQAATSGARDESSLWSSPVTDARGDVYYGTRDGHLYGYDSSGRQLFDVRVKGAVYSTGALTDDGGYVVGAEDGKLYFVG